MQQHVTNKNSFHNELVEFKKVILSQMTDMREREYKKAQQRYKADDPKKPYD